MNTIDYSLLIKDMGRHKKIEKLQRIKRFTDCAIFFWLVLFWINFFSAEQNEILSTITFVALLIALGIQFGFYAYFRITLSRFRKEQTFDSAADADFIAINTKYDIHVKRYKKTFITSNIIFFAVIVVIAVMTLLQLSDIFAVLLGVVFAGWIIAEAIIGTIMRTRFASSIMPLTDSLRKYFDEAEGISPEHAAKRKRRIFTNISDSQKMLHYLFPDESLRKKMNKMTLALMIPSMIIGLIFGIIIVPLMSLRDSPVDEGLLFALSLAASILFIIFMTIISILTAIFITKLHKQQRTIFEADTEKYKYYLELSDLYKKHIKRTNAFSIITGAVIFSLAIILGIIAYLFEPALSGGSNPTGVLGLTILGLFIFLVITLPVTIILTVKYRRKARVIENKIDESENNKIF